MGSKRGKGEGDEIDMIISSLPTEKGWVLDTIYNYQGLWVERPLLEAMVRAQQNFVPQPNDVILATYPKCGTTWFAALLFTIMNRARYTDYSTHPLLENSPHDCSRWMGSVGQAADIPPPVVKAHSSFTLLPQSVTTSACPIVYVCRNPADVFVSLWFFMNKLRSKEVPPLALDEAFEMYCKGVCNYGSYWDHVLGYLNASKERPDQVLFLRYEDMQSQPITVLKKLAEFVGCPFSTKEEQDGVIVQVNDLCRFESLSRLEVNQDSADQTRGVFKGLSLPKNAYFRNGKVGDYKTVLTDGMIQRLKEITSIKFKDSGLEVFE